jgi:hypothetical protein
MPLSSVEVSGRRSFARVPAFAGWDLGEEYGGLRQAAMYTVLPPRLTRSKGCTASFAIAF